jgi:hypothetical protein
MNSPGNFGRMGSPDFAKRMTSNETPKIPLENSIDLGKLGTSYKSGTIPKSRWKVSVTKQPDGKLKSEVE